MFNIDEINEIVSVIEKAAAKIIELKSAQLEIKYKDDGSEFTNADLASNKIICEFLKHNFLSIPIISEEDLTYADINKLKEDNSFWLLDPLDGTRGFIKGDKYYTINLGLIKNGVPIFGVINLPELGLTYFNKNNKLYKKNHNNLIEIKRSNSIDNDTKIKVVISARTNLSQIKSKLSENFIYEIKSMPSAIKFCQLIEGSFDIYPRLKDTYEWDIAAGHALVRAIGGRVLDVNLQELKYLKPNFLNHEVFAIRETKYLECIKT
jgi:3'(2'), 5'-bisphosphate nucleotidase